MNHRRGFTLIELLLVVAVLMIFMASAVFYMSPALRGVQLEEGAARFESLFKFASAEATQTGKRVVIRFVSTNDFSGQVVYLPRVAVEKDPTGAPGVFSDLGETSWMDVGIGELVSVSAVFHEEEREEEDDEEEQETDSEPIAEEEQMDSQSETNEVKLSEKEGFVAILGDVKDGDDSSSSEASGEESQSDSLSIDTSEVRDVLFYPDGSSETVEVHLISCDPEDERMVVVLLNGITGMIERKIYSSEEETTEEEETQEEGEDSQEELPTSEEDETSTNSVQVTPL